MCLTVGKLYFENGEVKCIPYAGSLDGRDYSTFVWRMRADGYRQVIVTSEIMLDYIKAVSSDGKRKVYKIELADDNKEFEKLQANVPEVLQHLADRSSLSIKKIYVAGPAENYFIQSNGIVGVDEEHFDSVTKEIGEFVKECLYE